MTAWWRLLWETIQGSRTAVWCGVTCRNLLITCGLWPDVGKTEVLKQISTWKGFSSLMLSICKSATFTSPFLKTLCKKSFILLFSFDVWWPPHDIASSYFRYGLSTSNYWRVYRNIWQMRRSDSKWLLYWRSNWNKSGQECLCVEVTWQVRPVCSSVGSLQGGEQEWFTRFLKSHYYQLLRDFSTCYWYRTAGI